MEELTIGIHFLGGTDMDKNEICKECPCKKLKSCKYNFKLKFGRWCSVCDNNEFTLNRI